MRAISLTLFLFFIFSPCVKAKGKKKGNNKYASIVIDGKTGKTLYSRNGNAPRYPASLTKMMTLYLLFESLEKGKIKLFQKLKVSKRASKQQPTKLYLRPGSYISVRDCIFALVTKSANDVAVVVAEALGKSEKNFAKIMTRKAKKLGMQKTTFGNASGLPGGQRLTTASDMAKLARSLYVHFPQFYHYFKTKTFRYKKNTYRNHNRLLGKVKGLDGLKTGYTRISGRNLATSVQRGKNRIFTVVMGGRTNKSRDNKMKELIEIGMIKVASLPRHVVPRPRKKPYFLRSNKKIKSKKQPVLDRKIKFPSPIMEYIKLPVPSRPPSYLKSLKSKNNFSDIKIPIKKESLKKSVDKNNWMIQLGAFSIPKKALKLAKSIKSKIPILKKTGVIISAVDSPKTLYQARLRGLTKSQADKV